MAVKNPKKQFNFRVSIPASPILPVFSIQELTLPDLEISPDEHGEGNTLRKTAGLITIGTATLSRIMPSSEADATAISKFFWNWAASAQDNMTGGGNGESLYMREVLVHEMGVGGTTVINTYVLIDAWPTKINGKQYKRTETGNLVEEVELVVNNISLL